jgi:flavin-dependent dehydrogenase
MTDVLVAGAGPAGSLAALLLTRAGARVTMVERARFPRPKLCGDTLNPGAVAILSRHLDIAPLAGQALPIRGMLLTGPGPTSVRGRYGAGERGLAVMRETLDHWLVETAVAAGARLVEETTVTEPIVEPDGIVIGARTRDRHGTAREYCARMTIGADGRRSRLAAAQGMTRLARRPRRWAIGAYFDGVDGLSDLGEMHVRAGHYLGVAPSPTGSANACLVQPLAAGDRWPRPEDLLASRLSRDVLLAPRFRRARRVTAVHVLGPMAIDPVRSACPGLLLAGDASGFVDPMTGDGIRLALSGAELAARTALAVLNGRRSPTDAAADFNRECRRLLAPKRRFNRALRALVSSSGAIGVSATAAGWCPAAFTALIRHAGDCGWRSSGDG